MADWRNSEAETTSKEEEAELLRQLAKGNEAAFSSLYESYHGPIYRFAWHMSGNRATADEITQEVFLLLIGNPRAYDPAKGSVAGYLFGIARNLTRRTLLQRRLDIPLEDEEDLGEWADGGFASHPDVLAEISQQELLDCLRKAVPALPESYREVIVLCEMEEMSYADAAAILRCPPGTVASRLHRAREILKMRLTRQRERQRCER